LRADVNDFNFPEGGNMCDKPIHSRSNIDMMAWMILVYPPGHQEILVKVMPRGGAAIGEPFTQTGIK
jgi:hypothetical protein